MTVKFACGHRAELNGKQEPVCGCGERRIERVWTKPPTIVGCAVGPHVQTKMLDAMPVSLASEALSWHSE